MGANNAVLTDPTMLIQAGIDPKPGLPLKVANMMDCKLKDSIRKTLRILDEQNAINRYTCCIAPCQHC